ncbi:ribosome-binding protein 1-like isoform X1 [Zerene cesonia]|uniref:ribosome-binding protein 1-like isoform X1 n=1 Tax=Zerene cesonia TaxID=33412 RepID=UPI0018E5238D|nr:ribosome-binding protein 1-like isoform X1 [Zerene cesonia]XP_038206789.1 ribosome-binding protein 1-like isoform X1 [Zerene cesonia]XP_038206790.1 ribosome-binding protein 1-like isoform X1 [Zerene cesonia]XP_038206791.1 ribosome-binding protein 1-like isoform X1 [Zerene cesonia]
MELQALLVLCGVGVAGVAVLLLMGLFSTSGTSYEEAIAQQRKATSELLALAENKSKNKKTNKKANKKLAKKEKNKENPTAATGSEPESEAPAESGVEDEPVSGKPHVEFSPPVVVEVPTDPPLNIKIRKRGKDSKVKPILVNKEDPSCVSDPSTLPDTTVAPVVNHFEEMQPKDEFELLHSTLSGDKATEAKEEIVEKKESKENKTKQAKGGVKVQPKPIVEAVKDDASRERRNSGDAPKEQRKAKKIEKKSVEEGSVVEEIVPPLNAPQPSELTTEKLLKQALVAAPVPAPSPPAKGKKKKAEPNVLSLMAGDSGGVSVSELVRVVKEASLSRTEIQILTDALLNKQHDPLPEHSEWTEGPNDPMQKLKKQLADKEKALADEIEASQALHAKLKELRGLLNAERGRAVTASRAAEQAAAAARAEAHTLQTRLQRLLDDNHALAQEKLLLQAKLGEEGEAQAQRVQMEMHIQRLSEAEAALVQQLTALQAELSARVLEAGQARCEAGAARDSMIMAQQHAADLAQQLQEANRLYAELEQQRQCAVHADQLAQQELRQTQQRLADLQNEVQRLTARAQTAENSLDKVKEDYEKQKEELSKEVASLREQLAARESELAELKMMKITPAQNGLPLNDANEQQKAAELAKVESVVEALRRELSAAQADNQQQKEQLAQLLQQLDHYKEKNNELRTKNWKVMEALQSAERSLQAKASSALPAQDTVSEAKTKADETNYNEVINVLRAMCPAAVPANSSGSEWIKTFADNIKNELQKKEAEKASFEKLLKEKLLEKENEKKQLESEMQNKLLQKENERKKLESEVQKKLQETEIVRKQLADSSQKAPADARLGELAAQNEHLQALVDKYKRIIDDTEGVLSRLQQNVAIEESRWAQQLADKQKELDDLKHRTLSQMQNKIDQLQSELQKSQFKSRNVTFAEAERLTEEKLISSLSDKHEIDVHNGPLKASLGEK